MKPFVSVLIPVKNEAEHIEKCILSLQSQSYPQDRFEIIVTDNGSTDGTIDILKTLGVHVLSCDANRIGAVRNFLAHHAKGEVFAYIDGDCTAPIQWISKTVEVLYASDRIGAIGGYIRRPENCNWLVSGWALNSAEATISVDILATGSLFIKRNIFEEIKGFNESLRAGEDTDLSQKLISQKYELLKSPCAAVIHWGYPSTVKEFLFRQIWQTSDYLHTIKKGFDVVFIITALTLGLLIVTLISVLVGAVTLSALCLLLMISLPSILGALRLYRSDEQITFSRIIKVCTVNILYILGRAIGLTFSIIRLVKKS